MKQDELPLFKGLGRDSDEDTGRDAGPPKHLTVSELTAKIRGILEPSFSEIWVQGEVSNTRPAGSGHLYFSLKDSGSTIAAAVFGWGGKKKPPFEMRDGLQVLCRGKVSVYPPRGNYQLIIDHVEPLGAGALQLAFEQLKAKLASEGLFDPKRKRTLPPFPKKIAVITSPSGAAIRDMLNIMKRRAPNVEVLVIPAVVQGDDAPRQLIRGIDAANQYGLAEILVLARGGGSMEDLWCFNDENLARAIAKSKIPVISAVGHEIDFTISDFVSDLRAPTPSAAAELVTGHWADIAAQVRLARDRMRSLITRDLMNRRQLLALLSARVVSPIDKLREQAQRTDDLAMRLERAMQNRLEHRRLALGRLLGKMEALSPLRVLERGYSIMKGSNGGVIRSQHEVKKDEIVTVTFHDGQTQARIL